MGGTNVINLFSTVMIIIVVLFSVSVTVQSQILARKLHEKELMSIKKLKKWSHLHFFFHDIIGGRNPTAVRVAQGSMTQTSATSFGAVVVMDNPLTIGPNITSKLMGRAQGIYATAGKEVLGLLMVLNYVFVDGEYNCSTLSILGRNEAFSTIREMPIVGGSGVFRFARGYAQAKTYSLDANVAVVEYNVYVLHY